MKLSALGIAAEDATTITAGPAIRHIEEQHSKREFKDATTYELMCLEDELRARIDFLIRLDRRVPGMEAHRLDAIREEVDRRAKSNPDLIAEAQIEWTLKNKIWSYFPNEGPLRRGLYVKHMQAFAQGGIHEPMPTCATGCTGEPHRERLVCGANKTGKTQSIGAFETVLHLTGRYPEWWPGYRFDDGETVDAWVSNKSAKDCRDINEAELLGPPGDMSKRGTGMIPAHLIIDTTPKPGIVNACEFVNVRHVSGGVSQFQTKSFDQGRTAFQGRNKKFIWHDEECPMDVAGESWMRVMTTGGLLLYTYTPIMGLTELTTQFIEEAGVNVAEFALAAEAERVAK